MRYEGRLWRPPSEAESLIVQATIGCSWNKCTYCDMYSDKTYRERPVADVVADLRAAPPGWDKLFVADGDALGMPTASWLAILAEAKHFRRVSCYAMARNVLAKSDAELRALREAGLTRIYIGPESGDPAVLKRIAKGDGFDAHVEAARRAKAAGIELSVIFLLGAGGVERSEAHARGSAALATAMDPEFLAALTLTIVPGTPMSRARHVLPDTAGLLRELRTFVLEARPTDALFRTNHASNYLPLGGRLPRDGARMAEVIDAALAGKVRLRPEGGRGL